CQQANSHPPTF
nr:immunoglobulin light chain junction region [Macaca mulatta]